jgi:uncharacterized Rmd1/YagE family protein
MSESLFTSGKTEFNAQALLIGERLDLKTLGSTQRVGGGCLFLTLPGGGIGILFPYGAIVLFDVPSTEIDDFLKQIKPGIHLPFSETERESEIVQIRIAPQSKEPIDGNCLNLVDISNEKLQLVADVLGKSVALARYENSLAQQFARIEPFASRLHLSSWGNRYTTELLHHLGEALLAEHKIVAGAQIDDTPELLWDHPEFERLWGRLRDEFEIRERFNALNRKLALISRTAETALELLQNRRALRVEWYILGLIVFEIALTLVQWLIFGQ